MAQRRTAGREVHPLPIRILHWIWVFAMVCMILSGWAIYDASPDLPFVFPRWMTLGGWLAGGIAWHISAMWLLWAVILAYAAYGFASGHFRRDLSPPTPRAIVRVIGQVLRLRLPHRLGTYNAVQRLIYDGLFVLVLLQVSSGLAVWKPVQFGWLVAVFGGFPIARNLHLAGMGLIVGFVVLHLTLAVIYPRTILSMLVGGATEPESEP
jgi:thiosulfate reductase cytochrome b subunit